ncbi:hypothetical protein [Microbacterium cremeum]|uniref:hypothetical protein n=1 Tax=Microbacterium cremeum TaxID=2782169 RepID=UPI0018870535|nr:hypothetical protein [Microbacterium cremeum]
MSAIADDPGAELRELRERAYGPDADIQDDPVAMQRLRELEERERLDDEAAAPQLVAPAGTAPEDESSAGDAPGAADASPLAPAADAGEAAAAEAPAAPDGDAASPAEGTTRPETPPWWRRRMPVLWAASLVAAALLGAAASVSMQAVWSGQVAVLAEDPDGSWPEGFFSPPPEGGATFQDFHGLTPVRVPQQMGPEGTVSNCLYVLRAPSNGMMGAGCSAGTFPATAAILVTEQAPAGLRERFEPGTALQFVLDGSQVRVYAAAPVPGATP